VFSKKIQEFREACYALTGYKIDVLRDKQYRLQSMYAERSSDDLLFEVIHLLLLLIKQLLYQPFYFILFCEELYYLSLYSQ